jgi:hypothetical protein
MGRVWEGLPETKCLQNSLKQLLVFAFEQGHRAKVLAKLAPNPPSFYLLPSVGDIGRTTSGHSSDLKPQTSKPDAVGKFGRAPQAPSLDKVRLNHWLVIIDTNKDVYQTMTLLELNGCLPCHQQKDWIP